MKVFITGASSGIGQATAKLAAQRRHDLVIVARRKDRLDELAQELTQEYKINVEVIPADLTKIDERKKVIEYIKSNDIDIVINNAGFGSAGYFYEQDIQVELNQIDLNVKALVEITYYALERMMRNTTGTIVNVSSIASYQPLVGDGVYGATKAFVSSFTHAIREEVKEHGVNVMMVCPGLTSSEFMDRAKWVRKESQATIPEFIWQSPQEVAQEIFRGIDLQRTVVVPGYLNKIIAIFSSSLPGGLTRKMTAIVAKMSRTR